MNIYNKSIRIVAACCLFIMALSCVEVIDFDLNDQENQRIVVEGRITNELKHHRIRLSRTLSYYDNQPAPPVLGAQVYILEEGTNSRYDITLVDDSMGYYETGMISGKVGRNYTLVVEDGDNTYNATSYLDTIARMDSINYIYEYYDSYFMKMGLYLIRMSAYEPPPLGNIYMFNFYLNDTLYNKTLGETVYQNDMFFNDSYLSDIEIAYIPQERITSDTNTFVVEMISISEDEYVYNNNFLQEAYNNGSVFSGPPANIPSNFKNTSGGLDGVGFFGASSIDRMEMLLIKLHNDSTNNPDWDLYFK